MQWILLFSVGSLARLLTQAPPSQKEEGNEHLAKQYVKNWSSDSPDSVTILGYNGKSGTYPIGDDGSFMFYWFIESPVESVTNSTSLPLILWLQGGPGCSSMTGQFFEFGPIELNYELQTNFNSTTDAYSQSSSTKLQQRAVNWSQKAHLLFIDNPLGAGYSYAASRSSYVTNEEEMAFNLYELLVYLQGRYNSTFFNPAREFYIFGESYAGKYIPAIGKTIVFHNLNSTEPKINLQGVGIGDGITDPIYQFVTYGEYAQSWGLVDRKQQKQIIDQQNMIPEAIYSQDWGAVNTYQGNIMNIIAEATNGVNVYNFRNYTQYDTTYIDNWLQLDQVKALFHVPSFVQFQDCSAQAYNYLANDIPQSQASSVAYLLDHIRVLLYNGQNDIIINTPGALSWVYNLQWSGQQVFQGLPNKQFNNTANEVVGHYKTTGNLTQVIVYDSGHMVPLDQPVTALEMVSKFINNQFDQLGQARKMGNQILKCGDAITLAKNTESCKPNQQKETSHTIGPIEIEIADVIDEEINAKSWVRRYLARRQYIAWKIEIQRKDLIEIAQPTAYPTKAVLATEALYGEINISKSSGNGIQTFYVNCVQIDEQANYTGYLTAQGKLRHGYGIQIYYNGSKYEGMWDSDAQNGLGRYLYANGDMYQGNWKNGYPHGIGYFYSTQGGEYKGSWMEGKQHGYGAELYTDGSFYKGDYKNGQKHGVGRLKWKQGGRYRGQFKNDEFHGQGVYLWPNGKKYQGEWVNGKMQGKGTLHYPDGGLYEGDFFNDKPDGIGTYRWHNGKKYIGQWSKGKMHGTGTYFSKGKSRGGYWEHGKLTKEIQ